ncbi:MAG: prolipoprotein diacylglyceryl transferase [Elusimicrobia bacterium]|nr:prolipoprotein diacylglyceryl transferase [Elusimicrobiota bacterium]
MHPFLFTIAGFKFPAYGFMVAAGYLAAIIYLHRKKTGDLPASAKQSGAVPAGLYWRGSASGGKRPTDAGLCTWQAGGLTRDHIADLIFYSAIAGILGAKAVFAVTYWKELGPDFLARTLFLFRSFPYGFVFYGGLAAGTAVFLYYCRRRGLDVLRTLDYFAPALPLAHGFGRVGCFLAGCCHGSPIAAWGRHLGVVFSDPLCEVAPAYLGVPLHPAQLYEAAGNFLIFLGLHILGRKKAGPSTSLRASSGRGAVFAAYMASYSALRFSVEFLRGDDRGGSWLGLSPAQLLSVVFGLIALAIFVKSRKNGKLKI